MTAPPRDWAIPPPPNSKSVNCKTLLDTSMTDNTEAARKALAHMRAARNRLDEAATEREFQAMAEITQAIDALASLQPHTRNEKWSLRHRGYEWHVVARRASTKSEIIIKCSDEETAKRILRLLALEKAAQEVCAKHKEFHRHTPVGVGLAIDALCRILDGEGSNG